MSTRPQICRRTGLKWNIDKRSRHHFPSDTIASVDVSLHNPRCRGRLLACQLHWAKDLFPTFQLKRSPHTICIRSATEWCTSTPASS
jgi:hypothetical protein